MGNSGNKNNKPVLSGKDKKRLGEKFIGLYLAKGHEVARLRSALEEDPALLTFGDPRPYCSGFTLLHHACGHGYEEMVHVLFECGAEVDVRTDSGGTPLHCACRFGRETVARVLLARGAVVNAQTKDGWSPLHYASFNGHSNVVLLMLEHGAKKDLKTSNGWTPLHYAACNGHTDENVAKVLLEHGAQVNARRDDGWTALHLAAQNNHAKLARVLLDHGADRGLKNQHGRTPREVARDHRRGDHHNPSVLEVLDTYFPVSRQMVQVLLGLTGPTESALTRFAGNSAFERNVLRLVKCLLTGEQNAAFEQLQCDRDADD